MKREKPLGPQDYTAYVFDLDGTLFSIPVDWKSVRREVAAFGRAPAEGIPLFDWLHEIKTDKALLDRVFALVDGYELAALTASKPKPGAQTLLDDLSGNARLALVTMQGRKMCEKLLADHRFQEYFELVLTREDALDRAEQLDSVMKTMGTLPAEVLLIGDRANDVVSAQKAGVDVVIVGGAQMPGLKPTYAYPTLIDLRTELTRGP